jgi:hypothetical protein
MWSWHWSPLTQTSLLLSPSDGLALFLKTTLANGVKVVKKVITSKFRFHLIAIYALGCFRNFSCTPVPTKITLKSPPTLVRLVKEWILMLLIKKQLIWKLFIYWYLMSFFHKKNVTKCLGHHYAIWTSDFNFLLALISGIGSPCVTLPLNLFFPTHFVLFPSALIWAVDGTVCPAEYALYHVCCCCLRM